MLLITPTYNLMTPDKEDTREEAGVILKAGLEGDRTIDLVLLLALLLH